MMNWARVPSRSVQSLAFAEPTVTLHDTDLSKDASTKLVPITVMVLETYPAEGSVLITVGNARTVKVLLEARAPAPPSLNITVTFTCTPGADRPNKTTNCEEDKIVHEVAGVLPTIAKQNPP